MSRAALSLGSNIGDRLAHLQGALDSLHERGVRGVAVSAVYETAPVGGPDQDDFLNAVAIIETDLSPYGLLEVCQEVETLHDRVREVRWGPRTLDIDIIHMDGVTLDDPQLTLPHPRAGQRAFVCVPWADADPQAVLPRAVLADSEFDQSGVIARPDLLLALPDEKTP